MYTTYNLFQAQMMCDQTCWIKVSLEITGSGEVYETIYSVL